MTGIAEMAERLADVDASVQRLRRADFDLTNATANKRSKIAEFEASLPLAIREEGMRLMFVTHESFTTDGTADNTETFNLSNNLLDTSNTTDLVLYEDGTRVQPDSVDHAADTFDYTDDGTANDLDVYYVPRDPVKLTVEKHAPSGQGRVSKTLFDGVTSILHERNQNKEPPVPSFTSALGPVVPKNWTVEVYADGPVPLEWDEDTNGTAAPNALLSIPINRASEDVDGLAAAVKRDIVEG